VAARGEIRWLEVDEVEWEDEEEEEGDERPELVPVGLAVWLDRPGRSVDE